MAGVSSGSAQYIYACTRLRVRKSLLIPREDYLRMLNMSLPEITRFIGETNYRSEIDELGTPFSGINLVEVA
ncbi:MAG TPA: V-type ATPase subunit, partial [Methanoculleus thermophilus]|nr:V-type ATPase subunit [Methanoculleus thermophilus]